MSFNYQLIKQLLQLDKAGKWLLKDSEDDFFPDALNFTDIATQLDDYLEQRRHRIFQIDTFPHVLDYVPKANGMIREAAWLHPVHRLLYLGTLHYLLPKLDHKLPIEVYSYRRDSEDNDEYPFSRKMDRWRTFHNDFRHACLDDQTKAVLLTDIASYYDHIHIDELCSRINSLMGDRCSDEDKSVISFLNSLLKQWSTDGYGIPQNLDASSFYGSLFLSGVDCEMLDKRYRYFRWVDDIRICAKSKKQALRSLHDLQKALARYRLFLASDKTKIVIQGTDDFEALLDVSDDEKLSRLEDSVAKGAADEIESEMPDAMSRLNFHASESGNDRKFRAYANRLMQIGEYEEFKKRIHDFLKPFVIQRLESHPHRSDYWTKILQEIEEDDWIDNIDSLLRVEPSIYNWQRFYFWKLLTARTFEYQELLSLAKSTINNPISDMEAYQALIFIGKHGDNQDRETLFVQYFSTQRSYPIQRAILVAIQGMPTEHRDMLYDRALNITPEHKQLIEYLKSTDKPMYGIKFRAMRHLPDHAREIQTGIKRGIGKIGGRVVRYRLSRSDYSYD